MYPYLNQYPFFTLVSSQHQAEIVMSAICCFGSIKEKEELKPKIEQLQRSSLRAGCRFQLVSTLNNLLASYLHRNGDFSDRLIIVMSNCIRLSKTSATAM